MVWGLKNDSSLNKCQLLLNYEILKDPLYSQGCYLDKRQWLALVQVDRGTYAGDTESLD